MPLISSLVFHKTSAVRSLSLQHCKCDFEKKCVVEKRGKFSLWKCYIENRSINYSSGDDNLYTGRAKEEPRAHGSSYIKENCERSLEQSATFSYISDRFGKIFHFKKADKRERKTAILSADVYSSCSTERAEKFSAKKSFICI